MFFAEKFLRREKKNATTFVVAFWWTIQDLNL